MFSLSDYSLSAIIIICFDRPFSQYGQFSLAVDFRSPFQSVLAWLAGGDGPFLNTTQTLLHLHHLRSSYKALCAMPNTKSSLSTLFSIAGSIYRLALQMRGVVAGLVALIMLFEVARGLRNEMILCPSSSRAAEKDHKIIRGDEKPCITSILKISWSTVGTESLVSTCSALGSKFAPGEMLSW